MSKSTGLRVVITRGIIDIGVFSFLINVLLLVMPLYMLQVYDRVLPSTSIETLIYLSLIAIASLVFLGGLEVIRSMYSQRIAASIDRSIGSKAFAATLAGRQGADSGDIRPLRDLATLRSFVASRGLTTLFDLPFAPLFVVLLYFVHPVLFWVTVGGAALMVLVVVLNQIAGRQGNHIAAEMAASSNLTAQGFARNIETLRAMGMVRNVTEVWGKGFAETLRLQDRLATINAVFGGVSRTLRLTLQLAILGAGAWLVIAGEITAGMIFASSIVSGRALQPLDQLIAGWRQMIEAKRAWERLRQMLLKADNKGGRKLRLPEPSGAIAVQNLVYTAPNSSPGTDPIIKRLSFEIAAGESVAIIGPSRAGKSTLAKLLVGIFPAHSGSVKIDGADLTTWDDEQLGQHIGYLAQDVQLFPGTIAENVSRFDPSADDRQIIEAARRAQVHELILSQREGYETRIGASATLSGGERQRIGLARALYGNPRILVLDEPNSNLDSEGEAALEKALANARDEKTTVIIITHRLSIAASCDHVLMLRNGSIEALGPSVEVLRKTTADRSAEVTLPPAAKHPGSGSFGGIVRASAGNSVLDRTGR